MVSVKWFLPGVLGFIGVIVAVAILIPIETESEAFEPKLSESTIEKETFRLINEIRVEQGLMPLTWDDSLHEIAKQHSVWMAETDVIEHKQPNQRALDNGYICQIQINQTHIGGVGENLYWQTNDNGQTDKIVAFWNVDWWMNSPEHRDLMLKDYFSNAGIAVVANDDKIYSTLNLC